MERNPSETGDGGGTDRGAPVGELPSAEERVAEIAQRIGEREAVVFLDLDGTLAPIVEHPERAALPRQTRDLLAELAGRRILAIVSGRDLDDLRGRVGVGEGRTRARLALEDPAAVRRFLARLDAELSRT